MQLVVTIVVLAVLLPFVKNACKIPSSFKTPLKLVNGSTSFKRDGTNLVIKEGDSVKFECPIGYELQGLRSLTCYGESFISTFPKCFKMYCESPSQPINGFYFDMANKTTERIYGIYPVGSFLLIGCNDGYRLSSSTSQINCKSNDTQLFWNGLVSQPPICEAIPYCGDPGISSHGRRIGDIFHSGSKLFYSCLGGYNLEGEKSITCQENGRWDHGKPKCKPELTCNDPIPVKNGSLISWTKVGDFYIPGDEIELICDSGFRLVAGSERAHCLHTDTDLESYEIPEDFKLLGGDTPAFWDELLGNCEVINCLKPDVLSNGYYTPRALNGNHLQPTEYFPFNFKIEYKCNTGYRLIGRRHSRCADKGWSLRRLPICKKIRCRLLSAPRHGWKMENSSRDVGSYANFGCNTGYSMKGSKSRICLDNGKWSGETTSCVSGVSVDNDCGIITNEERPVANGYGRIFSGEIVTHRWPWMVALHLRYPLNRNKGYEFKCGGSLIAPRWVLTAAHCLKGKYHDLIEEDVFVELGHTNSSDRSHAFKLGASFLIIHEDFGKIPFDSDLALIKLNETVDTSSYLRTVCLTPNHNDLFMDSKLYQTGEIGTALGYGTFVPKSRKMYDNLREVNLAIRSPNECAESLTNSSLKFTSNMFCAGGEKGKDTCMGDSGGPMMKPLRNAQGSTYWIQIGLVSWAKSEKCGEEGEYGYYTKLSRFIPWIETSVNNN